MGELVASGLTKSFGRTRVLSGADLCVASGTLTALLGASGSGKTTLLRLVCGFERPDAGTIAIAGRLVATRGLHQPPEHRRVGYVAQDGALFPHLSAADNILFGLRRRERTQGAAERLLALVGLRPAHATRRPHELSGGEQQRIALARALAAQPSIILLDEPFSSLDAAMRGETRRAVADAIAQTGATALLVTHDQGEALSMGAAVAVLRDGRMVQVGSPEIVYRRPIDVALARFLGEAIVVPGHAAANRVTCVLGELSLAPGMPTGRVDVMVRPEQVRLLADSEPGGRAAEVAATTFYGPDASATLMLLDDPATRVLARLPGHLPIRRGARVRFVVSGDVATYAAGAPSEAAESGYVRTAGDPGAAVRLATA